MRSQQMPRQPAATPASGMSREVDTFGLVTTVIGAVLFSFMVGLELLRSDWWGLTLAGLIVLINCASLILFILRMARSA